jgi:hypothetical protein
MTATAEAEAWGQLGPAMRELNEMQREFVVAYLTGKPGHGAKTAAARRAGYTGKRLTNHAHDLCRNPKIIAAINEESKKYIRGAGHAEAVAAVMNLVRDPEHRDHARALDMVLSRADPAISKHSLDVTHRVEDPDRAALEELRALRQLGTAREKLLDIYGPNGLDRLEALEAVENAQRATAAKIIDGQAVEYREANHG